MVSYTCQTCIRYLHARIQTNIFLPAKRIQWVLLLPTKDKLTLDNNSSHEIYHLAYQRISPLNKIFFVLSSIVGIGLSGYALYVTIVACGATLQISTTKAKLPFVHKKLYSAPDLGPVCAFNHKGGNIRSFPTQQEAHLANYQIAHCGACGHCSNWISETLCRYFMTCMYWLVMIFVNAFLFMVQLDLELEYSTRNTLAVQSQKCAIQSLFSGGFDGLSK